MSHFILIRHNVRDFKAWKRGFENHRPKRLEAGLSEKQLLRNTDNAEEVVLLLEAEDLGRAKAFIASAELRETMQTFGVVGKPEVYFLND
jgi:hypothetical protein